MVVQETCQKNGNSPLWYIALSKDMHCQYTYNCTRQLCKNFLLNTLLFSGKEIIAHLDHVRDEEQEMLLGPYYLCDGSGRCYLEQIVEEISRDDVRQNPQEMLSFAHMFVRSKIMQSETYKKPYPGTIS